MRIGWRDWRDTQSPVPGYHSESPCPHPGGPRDGACKPPGPIAQAAGAALPWGGRAELCCAPAGLPTSEQYVKLEEQRRHRQRLEKERRRQRRKGAKSKPRRHSSLHTESDEDIAPAQQVDIVTEEMPEVRPPARAAIATAQDRGWVPAGLSGRPLSFYFFLALLPTLSTWTSILIGFLLGSSWGLQGAG